MDNKAATQYLQSVIRDTPIGILEMQQENWQEKPIEERLNMTCNHIDSSRLIFENSIRNRNPQWSETEVRIEAFRNTYHESFSEDDMNKIIYSIRNYNRIDSSNSK